MPDKTKTKSQCEGLFIRKGSYHRCESKASLRISDMEFCNKHYRKLSILDQKTLKRELDWCKLVNN